MSQAVAPFGSFTAKAEGIDLNFKDSNWIYYEFDWSDDT